MVKDSVAGADALVELYCRFMHSKGVGLLQRRTVIETNYHLSIRKGYLAQSPSPNKDNIVKRRASSQHVICYAKPFVLSHFMSIFFQIKLAYRKLSFLHRSPYVTTFTADVEKFLGLRSVDSQSSK